MNLTKIYYHKYLLIGFIFSIHSLLISCEENKYTQCEQIITLANSVASETKKIITNKSVENNEIKNWLNAAEIMTKAAEKMESLPIKDPQLLHYLGDFVKIYRTNSEATYSIVKARESRNLVAAQAAQADVKLAGEWERKLSSGINDYCQVK
ncbi:hypothetical protein Sta7437_0629 [Stanieria cyanosphaera PCC 7437]|uniref:Lipoprotein n=1 Tax=Stanieria cyanosphaera (strain ATCC 29371 / PCC 7437) TaxID=111780 RepID=K9XQ53_STAC7|nr:hypothetical protein [Stanieria cyanosphaera]AFZ34224.1 hypothetical protein Sta7437_0629 [Stanieria cyanosphaera PCC 7437]